jgi:hypothetical protein
MSLSESDSLPSPHDRKQESPYTTWQVSRKSKGFGHAERAQNPCFFVVNLRTLPSRDHKRLGISPK